MTALMDISVDTRHAWEYCSPRSFRMIPYSSEASSISSIALVLRASRNADDASVPSSMLSGPRDLCLIYKMSTELKDRMGSLCHTIAE